MQITDIKKIFVLLFLISVPALRLFPEVHFFYIQFTDKNNSPYALSVPQDYLSERAISRRLSFGIPVDSSDLPVNPTYISTVANTGVTVHSHSKWLNGITIYSPDSSAAEIIQTLPFVDFVEYTGKISDYPASAIRKSPATTQETEYGWADEQISQLNGKALHELDYTGQGMLVGLIDAGFYNADINPAFDDLRLKNRLTGAISIIDPSTNVYNEDAHGAYVLSAMAGNIPDSFRGTSPDASYLLIQTEYVPAEYLFEADFWVSGIEYADSAGVDVINSSLGYSEFDDPSMDYSYSDMDGTVSRASRAAAIAARKGILVCNSAGNSGNKPWKYISAPADAPGILSIGAINSAGTPAVYSSFGPSSDNRVKPEICALGDPAALVSSTGTAYYSKGTSYASPIAAGLATCFLQYCKATQPGISIERIIENIISSSSLYETPSDQMGYGIPDFGKAIQQTINSEPASFRNTDYQISVNNTEKRISIRSQDAPGTALIIEIYAMDGKKRQYFASGENEIQISTSLYTSGIYIIRISGTRNTFTKKIQIQ